MRTHYSVRRPTLMGDLLNPHGHLQLRRVVEKRSEKIFRPGDAPSSLAHVDAGQKTVT